MDDAPPPPPPPLAPTPHRPWSTVLVAVHNAFVVAAVALAVTGVVLIALDKAATHDPDAVNEPLGALAGLVMIPVGVVATVITGAFLRGTVVGRREADRGAPRPFGASPSRRSSSRSSARRFPPSPGTSWGARGGATVGALVVVTYAVAAIQVIRATRAHRPAPGVPAPPAAEGAPVA